MNWRLIIQKTGSPARNMAVDEALLRLVTTPVLRLYKWDRPAVSLGYFQKSTEAPPDRPWIRRYTGGGLVDHARDVTYTIVIPRSDPLCSLSTPESYEKIHRGVVDALTSLHINAKLTPCCDPNESNACFQKAVRYDVIDQNGAKLAGAAQRRTREGMLHQGSILLPDVSLNDSVAARLPACISNALQVNFSTSSLTESESAKAELLEKERYQTEAWNLSEHRG